MSVYLRRGSPCWQIELQVNGIKYRRSSKTPSRREARIIEAKLRTELLLGRTVIPAALAPAPVFISLGEVVERYWTETIGPRQQKRDTAKCARFVLDLVLKHFGEDRRIDSITTAAVASWRSTMLTSGLAGASVNKRLGTLRAVLRKAKRWGLMSSELPDFDMVRCPGPEDRYLSDAEYDRLLSCCDGWLRRLTIFLAGTGCRLTEATGLTWDRVDLANRRVLITQTKGRKSRGVPMPREVAEMLAAIEPKVGRVFPHDHFPKSWKRAKEMAGLPWLRQHDLRHFYCARLIRRGASLRHVQLLAGHSSPALTARYSALAPSDLAQAVAVLD